VKELRRTFLEIKESSVENEEAQLVERMGFASEIGWEELLKAKRILIISEAGAGKSFECLAQQKALWDQGQAAFCVELATLAADGLRDSLSPDKGVRFDAWLSGEFEKATFFLDSVDELKLTTKSFGSTLNKFAKAIGTNLGRACIVLTSRPGPLDRELVREHLPIPEPLPQALERRDFADIMVSREELAAQPAKADKGREFRSFALAPLSDVQIKQFAASRGVKDPDQMLAAILAGDAKEYARSPLDLIALCDDWREGQRIRRHREQAERNIEIKLAARTDRSELAPLSVEKAREGARRLALATFLTRRFSIRHSAEADSSGTPGTALDPGAILPDWTTDERLTLLERPLFNFASYGRVRFHHRSTTEFLAAERLDELLSRGMTMRAVKRHLFFDAYEGVKLIRPRMRPVAAWLAARHVGVFQEILEREPEVLLNHADPSVLDPEQRKSALRAFVATYGRGNWRGIDIPRLQVQRFGSPELVDEVKSRWAKGVQNPEVREFLLELVETVSMHSCASIAESAAENDEEVEDVRFAALRALAKVDPVAVTRLVESMIVDPPKWPDSLIRFSIPILFPTHITAEQLLRLLARLKASGRTFDSFELILGGAISRTQIDTGDLKTLCVGLAKLVRDGVSRDQAARQISTTRRDLILSLADICVRLLKQSDCDSDVLEASVLVFKVAEKNHRTEERVGALRELFTAFSEDVRERLFWMNDRLNDSFHTRPDPWNRLWAASYEGPISINFQQDRGWILRTVADKTKSPIERHMMLFAAMNLIAPDSEDRTAFLEGLKPLVADAPTLVSPLEDQLNPPTVDERSARLQEETRRRTAVFERRKERDRKEWVEFQRRVREDPQSAFHSDRAYNTALNLWRAMLQSEVTRGDIEWNPSFVEEHFGTEVVRHLRMAMPSIWRRFRPTLRYERKPDERNQYPTDWELGLAAVFAEAEDPGWARRLSDADAELATRYAPIQFNGFAPWLESLAEAHPDTVERTLGPEIEAELDEGGGPHTVALALQNVRHGSVRVAKLFVPRLKKWVEKNYHRFADPQNNASIVDRISQVADILLEHDSDARAWLAPLAADVLSKETASECVPFWVGVLSRLDPSKAVEALEFQLGKILPSADGLAIGWFAALFGDSRAPTFGLSHIELTPGLLKRLVCASYFHVRPTDDLVHHGTYSPGVRDDATSARNRLLGALLDAKGREAWLLKLELANEPLIAHFRDRFVRLAREKLAEEIDSEAMTEADIIAIGRNLEAPPRTRDEMFALLKDRIEELEDVLRQDTSPRNAWALIKIERDMRRVIAREFEHAARQAYVVDQESVTADEKETDIRLRSTASEQQAVIELKIGESKWSGRDLRDTLREQIVGRYMGPENRRSGCLMITVAKDRTWDDPDTGASLDVDGLQLMLEREANRIEAEENYSVRLLVKILDLRPRQSKT
jgi:hypothetical protein